MGRRRSQSACAAEIRMRRSLEMGGNEQAWAGQESFECGRQASGRAAGALAQALR